MSDAWFDNEIAPDGAKEDGCHPDEAQALKSYLRGELTAEQAACKITKPTETDADPGNHISNLWGFVQDALIDIPSARGKVIQLLQEIQKLPPVDMTNKERNSWLTDPSEELWRDLPAFINLWSDTYRWKYTHEDFHQHEDKYTSEHWDKVSADAHTYANIEAQFLAGRVDGAPADWGFMCVCDALERSNAMLDVELPAAKEWLVIAGQLLRDHKVSEHEGYALGMQRNLWEGGKCMSKERWAFWKERLMSARQDQRLKEATKQAAKEALDAMNATSEQ